MKSLYLFLSRVKSASNTKSTESFASALTNSQSRSTHFVKSLVVSLAILFAGIGSAFGQVNLYTFAQTAGTYADITGGTVLITASSNTFGNAGLPDEQIYNITIPFTFTFNGAGYTSLNISANGFVTFGPTAPTGTNYTPISSAEAYAGAISAWGRDLSGMFNVGGRTSTLRWQTVGVAPNREVVIQFKNWRPAYSTSTTLAPFFDFQIRLKETSNIIDVIFGPSGMAAGTANTGTTAQVGLRGANNTFTPNVLNRTNATTLSVNSSTAGTTNASTQAYSSVNATPGSHTNGKIYRWTPPAPPACAVPSALTSSGVTNTSATISWTAASPAPASGYEYFYSTSATAPTAGTTPSGSTAAGVVTANITGLTANTTYYFWVRSNCGGSGTSTWAGASTFFTGYCQPTGTGANTSITNVVTSGGITNLSNASAFTAGGYANFTAQSCSQSAGGTINFTLTYVSDPGTKIFIDWNNDLDFNDAGENVYSSNAYVLSTVSGSFAVPVGQAIGNYRMRIVADWNSTTPIACPVGINGETEDYTFTVAAPPSCPGPTALVGTPITLTSATISWTAPSPAPTSGYQYYVSTSATSPLAGTTPTGTTAAGVTTANLSSLTIGTTYYFWVRSVCSVSDLSSWAGAGSFYVGYCVPVTTFGCTDGDVIARVVLNTLDNNSGTGCPSGLAGYSDYTTNPLLTTTLLPSSTYNCTVYAGQYGEGYAAWIDYNDDGVFDNATERIGYSNGQVAGSGIVGVLGSSAAFPITLACTPPAGTHRLRVRAMYFTNGVDVTPCTANAYGEVEDYLITIAPAPACPSPGLMSTLTPTSNSVALTWALGCSSSTNYDFEFGVTGFSLGSGTQLSNQTATISGSNASYTLSGLQAGTTYDIYFRANCGGGATSVWSLVSSFTTLNSVSAASSTPTLCEGTALTSITHTTIGATGIGTATGLPSGVTAAWSSNIITISGTPTVSGVFSYSIPLTGGVGSVNATGSITVLAAPSAPTATSPQVFCETANATIASLQVSGAVGSTFAWYTTATGGVALSNSTSLSIGTTNYFVQAIGTNGCVSLTRTSVSVTENPLLSASVSITGTTACPGGVLLFTATPVNGGTSPTYQWYNNGVVIPNETASTYSASGLLAGDVINVKMIPSGSCVTVCP